MWPALYEDCGHTRVQKHFAIPMWYVSKIQQEEFWQRDWSRIESDLKFPWRNVPVSYVCHLTMPCTLTMVMQRDKKKHRHSEQSGRGEIRELLCRSYKLIKDLTEARASEIAIYRCMSGKLVVCKTTCVSEKPTYDITTEELPLEVIAYRKMVPHSRIVGFIGTEEIGNDRSEKRYAYRLVLDYCNGGDLDHLAEHGRARKQPLPEAFIWHVLKQSLEALVQTTQQRIEHLDVHPGNLFLHFDESPEGQHPELKLGDFSMCRFLTDTQSDPLYETAIRELGYYLLDNVMQPLDKGRSSVDIPQYSQTIMYWLETISGRDEKITLQSLMQDLYPLIPSFVRSASTVLLPDWMIEYFQNLQNL